MPTTKYVAHRGFSMRAPENTTAAFELAGRSGFWGIECDTYCTTDGHWIVHHDRTVDRMTNGSGRTKLFTLEEIRNLRIVAGHNIEAYPKLKIPVLEEVLEICKAYKMHAFIEIEEYHRDSDLERLVRLVRSCGMHGQSSFICFNPDDLRKVRALDAEVPLGFLSAKPPSVDDLKLADELKPMFLDYDYKVTTPEVVRACREAGVEVSLWTINRREDSLRFIEAGVDYITTDTLLLEE